MPNWVSNLLVLNRDDAEAILPYLNEDNAEREEGDLRLDFERIIPMPETVYRGNSGVGEAWHPSEMSLAEYKAKYPLGDWYKWSINNWGTKWNACNCSFNPPMEDEPYGILTFDTAWSLPLPVLEALYEFKGVNFQLYFVEESHAFFGAIPFTENKDYPEYMDDPNGENHPDVIFGIVMGEGEFDYLEEDHFEVLEFAITRLKRVHDTLDNLKRPEDALDGTVYTFLQVKEDYITDLIQLTDAVVHWKSGGKQTFSETVRALNNYAYPKGEPYTWTPHMLEPDSISSFVATLRLREQIQKTRMLALNTSVGLNYERCNERLYEILRYEQLQVLSPAYQLPENLTVDSVKGKRLLFKHLLRDYSYEGLQYKIEKLIRQGQNEANQRKSNETNNLGYQQGYEGRYSQTVNNIVETAIAVVELYDDIPNMDTIEFLRLMDVYIRTNLFQLDDENVKSISQHQLDDLIKVRQRIGVVSFKNMVQTGLVDNRFVTPVSAYIKTENLGL
jgi:hypothetical protein